MSPRVGDRTTLAAEASGGGDRHQVDTGERLGGTGPEEGNDPADNRPPQKQVEQEDACRVALIPANKGRQEVEKQQEQ